MVENSPSIEMHPTGPSPTPPSKEESFEQFKAEAGADLAKVLTENKGEKDSVFNHVVIILLIRDLIL